MTENKYPTLFQFTDEGLDLFEQVMFATAPESALDPTAARFATPVQNSGQFEVVEFQSAKEMAEAVCQSFEKLSPQEYAANIGLWAWLTFVMLDVLFPKRSGVRKPGAIQRWYPASPNDYEKAQRHLVRMPVLLLDSLGDDADHLICGRPGVGPEIREQLTSQQDMFSRNFQRACRMLYYDHEAGTVKKGTGGKSGPGVPRRLAAVRKQLDVTWDMTDLSAERILELLPAEFDKFKPEEFLNGAGAP